MTRFVHYLRKHATSRVPTAGLLLAAVLAVAGLCRPALETAAQISDLAPAVGTPSVATSAVVADPVEQGFRAAEFDGSSRAVRGVNVHILSERVSERNPASSRAMNAARRMATRPPTRSVLFAALFHDAAPPRALFYLHLALLI